MEWSIQEMPDHLRIRITGAWTLAGAEAALAEIRDRARNLGITAILLDVIGLLPPSSELVRYDTGKRMAELWGPKFKVAAWARRETVNFLAVNVAVNRGARLALFFEEAEALAWLLDVKPGPPGPPDGGGPAE